MTRQEAVKPTPEQAAGQLSATRMTIPRRTHQTTGGAAMPVPRSAAGVQAPAASTAPVAPQQTPQSGAMVNPDGGRQQMFQQAVQNAQQQPGTMQEAMTSPALQPAVDKAKELAQQSEQARAAAAQGAVDAQKEQQWMSGQRRMNGDGQQELQQGAGTTAADRATRQMTPGGDVVPGFTVAHPQQSSGTVNHGDADAQPQVASMDDLIGYLRKKSRDKLAEADETPEQKAAREKREKRERLLATIGDGLGAFHEAYSYMRGIKPMTSGSLSAAQEARVRALGLERDKKYSDALENYLKVLDAQRKEDYYKSIADTRRAQQESLDRDRTEKRKMQQEKNQAYINLMEAKRQNELEKSDYYTAYLNALNSGADIETAKAYANQEVVRLANEREAADAAVKQSKVDANKAQANQRNAAANASNARADKTRAGGSSSGTTTTTTTTYDKNGNVKGTKVTTKSKGNGGSRRSSSGKKNGNGKKPTNVNWKK